MTYREELTKAMTWLGAKEDTYFMGQSVGEKGTAMHGTLAGVPEEKKLELPVFEEMQMGMAFGMSMNGTIPITIFPRWNFLLLAINQLVNHIDKSHAMGAESGVIIRVGVGSVEPLDPQWQHKGDFSLGMKHILDGVQVFNLDKDIQHRYEQSYLYAQRGGSSIVVEESDRYNEK